MLVGTPRQLFSTMTPSHLGNIPLSAQKSTDEVNGFRSLINDCYFEVFPSHPHKQVTPKDEHMSGNFSGDFSPLPPPTPADNPMVPILESLVLPIFLSYNLQGLRMIYRNICNTYFLRCVRGEENRLGLSSRRS